MKTSGAAPAANSITISLAMAPSTQANIAQAAQGFVRIVRRKDPAGCQLFRPRDRDGMEVDLVAWAEIDDLGQ